ncbi:hypothetical protein [Streptomyces sp. NPDC003006]
MPAPRTVLGYRRDGRPIFPVLGASPEDPSNDEATVSVSQKQLNTMMAREKDQGGRAAVRSLIEKLGFSNTAALEEYLAGVRQAEQDRLTETERREQAVIEHEQAPSLGRLRLSLVSGRQRVAPCWCQPALTWTTPCHCCAFRTTRTPQPWTRRFRS